MVLLKRVAAGFGLAFYRRHRHLATLTSQAREMTQRVELSEGLSQQDWRGHVLSACQSLKSDQIIAVPTDTIYGIAGLAQSHVAVNRIYDIKQRNLSKPIAICVGEVSHIHRWGKVTTSEALLQDLLPGPVTVVFERTEALNPDFNPDTFLVGIRVPDHGFVCDVVKECGEPLALTSANLSNAPSSLSVEEFSDLWPQLATVFDGGVLTKSSAERAGSTVVDLSQRGFYKIIRPGSALRETSETLRAHGLKERLSR